MPQSSPSAANTLGSQRANTSQESYDSVVGNFQTKNDLKPLVVSPVTAFNKAAIRTTYCNVFADVISRFMPRLQAPIHTDNTDQFIVCARVRPFSEEEETIRSDLYDCVTTADNTLTVHTGNLHLNKLEIKHITFHLDNVFGKCSSNQDVYNVVRQAIVQSIPQKDTLPVDSTVFLYGKTGSGKSFTINGIADLFAQDVFYLAKNSQYDIRIGISAVEIMAGAKGFIVSKDNVCDLYNDGALVYFREDAHGTVHLRGAKEYACDNSTQMNVYIKKAKDIRRTQATTRNAESSRSHLIYFVRIRTAADNFEDGEIISTITFVDLAGNEGQQDSLYHKGNSDQIKDSTSINRSLASLQDCIRTAAEESKVIPFRGSVLTRLLKKCFCSKESKTVFIGTISGLPTDTEQSVLTLKYTGLVKWSVQDFVTEQIVKLNTTL